MSTKKIKKESDIVLAEKSSNLANHLFNEMIHNGGCDMPMIYVMETFLMLAARVGVDMHHSGTKVELIKNAATGIFGNHFDLYLEEDEDRDEDTMPVAIIKNNSAS